MRKRVGEPAEGRVDKMVAEYREKLPTYQGLATTCKELLERVLSRRAVRVHSVTCRAKTLDSLKGKLAREERQCEELSEVTDLAGIRIITYFSNDVDAIGRIIEREFTVTAEQSIDKRKALDPDRFGYLSLHYVCTLSERRTRLAEYESYRGLVCEIQVRSILQHAWAEIEHDLGYKAAQAIPVLIRRRFFRLAGLLELADDEFMGIRNQLVKYASKVKREIAEKPSEVLLDKVSLQAFVEQDSTVRRVNQELAAWAGFQLEKLTGHWAEMQVESLRDVGLNTIEDVRAALVEREGVIVRQWQLRAREGEGGVSDRGISLFHLWEVLLAEKGDPRSMVDAFRKYGITVDKEPEAAASEIIEAVRKASADRPTDQSKQIEEA